MDYYYAEVYHIYSLVFLYLDFRVSIICFHHTFYFMRMTDTNYDLQLLENVTFEHFTSLNSIPVVRTSDVQRCLDYFTPWLDADNKQPFIIVGPEGCGKRLVLWY